MKKALLHVCCAPCSTHCIEELKNDGYEPTVYFYNPNIHPKEEYDKRLDEVKKYCKSVGCDLMVGDYDVKNWEKAVKGLEDEPEGGKRCKKCFALRLKDTARLSKEKLVGFTTSLTVSPYKDSKVIIPLSKGLAEEFDAVFLDYDFKKKEGYNKSVKLSRDNGIYRQDYCGCKYSMRKVKEKL